MLGTIRVLAELHVIINLIDGARILIFSHLVRYIILVIFSASYVVKSGPDSRKLSATASAQQQQQDDDFDDDWSDEDEEVAVIF